MELTTLEDVQMAAERIAGAAVKTPLLPCAWADADRPLYLKPENLQPMGAFKIRGATNMIGALDPARRARGVVTHSSGNHAQAVAMAARRFGTRAAVIIPDNAPRTKVEATRALGAEVILVPPAERESRAVAVANERGYAMIPPFDAREIIAGQGTVGLEIVEQLPEVESILVPCGGGGLLSGVATAVKGLAPRVRVVGVEPEFAADAADSFQSGELRPWDNERRHRTIADGVRTALSPLTFAHIRARVDAMVMVTEDEIRQAVRWLYSHARVVAEPSGALTTAAYLFHRDALPAARHHVAVISGGNVDPATYAAILTT
jgi:threonine dehydratase